MHFLEATFPAAPGICPGPLPLLRVPHPGVLEACIFQHSKHMTSTPVLPACLPEASFLHAHVMGQGAILHASGMYAM